MTYQQKFAALKGVSDQASITLIDGVDGFSWLVRMPSVERKEGHMLASAGSFGMTPELAIENTWAFVTDRRYHLVINATSEVNRREVKWNGFMWVDVPSPIKEGR